VTPIVRELLDMGVEEVSIGDTIGHATPNLVAELTEALLPILPIEKFAYHFHDTFGFALANVLMGAQYGIHIFDSSAGGVGGCPFAPGAAGNVATEELVAMLDGMGIQTGIDLDRVLDASRFLQSVIRRPLPSRYFQARR
jgi:hydroxymethylglutaryl-CoA lyase